MTDAEILEIKRKRRRRMKKFLRHLPRRSNIDRYPLLKHFAKTARKRDYIWQWHPRQVVRAIYIGWFIALIPMYGLQMIAAFLLSLIFRANCLLAMALQWIANPITMGPLLIGQYLLGDRILVDIFGMRAMDNGFVQIFETHGFYDAIGALKSFMSYDMILHIAGATILGGLILSLAGAIITHIIYIIWESRSRRLISKSS